MITDYPRIAYERGYRIVYNSVVSPRGTKRVLYTPVNGYPRFAMRIKKKCVSVKAHQLATWQKFGEDCLSEHIVVRHRDDDRFNFRLSNIELGTREDNEDDRYVNAILQEWIEQINREADELPF